MKNVIENAKKIFEIKTAHAHCDIPCGIYDPHYMQVAAHTVVRMDMLIDEATAKMKSNSNPSAEDRRDFVHKIARYTHTKEEHAEIVKKEARILWGDYFKPEHLQKFPELHDLVWKIMKGGSKGRQEADIHAGTDLLDAANKLADIFWKSKGFETKKVKAPYPTEKELVVPVLK